MEYPLISVKNSLVPTAIVHVKVFEAETIQKLEKIINEWVSTTQNLVVCPGPLTQNEGASTAIITYVSVGENCDPTRSKQVEQSNRVITKKRSNVSSAESDGTRFIG